MRGRSYEWLSVCVLVLLLACTRPACAGETPLVAAAASVKFALTEIAARFETETGQQLKLTFGSSGSITHQIEQGAPFEIFFAADEAYIARLFERGFSRDRGLVYAGGRLGLFVPRTAKFEPDSELAGLRFALRNGQIKRFAIANPAHAPYGRAARAALEAAGLWQEIQPLLALGENATQATQFAASGATQGGLIPLSLAQMPDIKSRGQFALLPISAHINEPLRHRMVLLKNAGQVASDFYAYLQQPAARHILTQYGFAMPPEESP